MLHTAGPAAAAFVATRGAGTPALCWPPQQCDAVLCSFLLALALPAWTSDFTLQACG